MNKTIFICVITSIMCTGNVLRAAQIDAVKPSAATNANNKVAPVASPLGATHDNNLKNIGLIEKNEEPFTKIRHMDVYKVCAESDQWKDETQAINNVMEEKGKEIKKNFETYNKKTAELQSAGNSLNETARDKKRKELLTLKNDIEIDSQTAKELEARMQEEAQMKLLAAVDKAAEEIQKEQNIDILLSGGVMKSKPQFDLSHDIAVRMNEHYAKTKKSTKKDTKTLPAPAVK